MKKPFLYALGAGLYIALIVSVASATSNFIPAEDTILAPMVMLSLLVFSVALMGFLFLSQPILLYLDGQKKEAFNFFLQTLGSFACLVLVFIILFFVIR